MAGRGESVPRSQTEIQLAQQRSTRLRAGPGAPVAPVASMLSRASFNTPLPVQILKQRENARRASNAELTPMASTPPAAAPEPAVDASPLPSQAATAPSHEDDWTAQDVDSQDEPFRDHYDRLYARRTPMSSAEVMAKYQRQQKYKSKENYRPVTAEHRPAPQPRPRFLNETQANAARVEFSSGDEDEAPPDGAASAAPATQSTSAPPGRAGQDQGDDEDDDEGEGGEEDEGDPSQDQGFQTDQRAINPDTRRHKPVAARQVPWSVPIKDPPSSSRVVEAEQAQESEADTSDSTDPPLAKRRSVSRSSRAPGSTEVAIDFAQVNRIAKAVTAARVPRRVQVRKAWSKAEVARLVEYIENDEYNTSWAKIQKAEADKEEAADQILAGRDQVALKDKARNLKMDFLKAGTDLPVNFENIRLAQRQIQILQSLGIDYQQ